METSSNNFTIMQFNILQEGNSAVKAGKPDGFKQIVDTIVRYNPDFVCFSENRNYESTFFCERLINALKSEGLKYFTHKKTFDTAIISKYEILHHNTIYLYEHKDDRGSINRIVSEINGKRYSIYSAHLDWRHYTPYQKHNIFKSANNMYQYNFGSLRLMQTIILIIYSILDLYHNIIPIIGGDFNEPSHLDWTEKSKTMFSRDGKVVNWQTSKLLQDTDFLDAYRLNYTNEIKYPGFTYPISYIDGKKDDNRDRLDFIYYIANTLHLRSVKLFGSNMEYLGIERSGKHKFKFRTNNLNNTNILSGWEWVSDHNGLLAMFSPIDKSPEELQLLLQLLSKTIYSKLMRIVNRDKNFKRAYDEALKYISSNNTEIVTEINKINKEVRSNNTLHNQLHISHSLNQELVNDSKGIQPFTKGFMKKNPNVIKCKACTFNNPLDRIKCELCMSNLYS